MERFDYIIVGAGAAGLSLAYALSQSSFGDKRILLLDKDGKNTNDRTWCYWEEGEGRFEKCVHTRWPRAEVKGEGFHRNFDLAPFEYKMIRGLDFYTHVKSHLEGFPNIEFRVETVRDINSQQHHARVTTLQHAYESSYVFDSRFHWKTFVPDKGHFLLFQHFLGWFIQTEKPCFDPEKMTFMDFDIPQEGDTRFMYILPFSPTEALVEYTFFTPEVLKKEAYESGLKDYLQHGPIQGHYEIQETEFGVIPMTTHPFPRKEGRVYTIGTAGGQSKASTGFTFARIQQDTDRIVQALEKGKLPEDHSSNRFALYDKVLLNVLATGKYPGDQVFVKLFQRNNPVNVLRFLNEQTSFGTELGIMMKSPTHSFTRAFFQEVFK